MIDLDKWKWAIAAVTAEYMALPVAVADRVLKVLARLKKAKLALTLTQSSIDSGTICAACGGECCMTGKYHFTVIDVLAHLADNQPFPEPFFDNGHCPYRGDNGCLMHPEYRPYNCITFNCDKVEVLLNPLQHVDMLAAEQDLRLCCRELEELFANRFMPGLLINCERDLLQAGVPILRGMKSEEPLAVKGGQ